MLKQKDYIKIFLLTDFALFVLLTVLAQRTNYFPFDLTFTQALQQINFPGFAKLMEWITFLGNPQAGTVLVVITVIIFLILDKKSISLFILVSISLVAIIVEGLKTFVSRPRPDPFLIKQVFPETSLDSFPSGHVIFFMTFFGFLVFLTLKMMKKSLLRNCLLVIQISLIILIGVSRIYLGEHWLSDVLGAYLFGAIYLTLLVHFYQLKQV